MIELDYRLQRTNADAVEAGNIAPQKVKCIDGVETRTKLLARSQIWDLYSTDVLVLDIKLRFEEDLESLEQWVEDIYRLNEVASNANPTPFRMLNQSKQAYAIVTAAPDCRELFEIKIQRMLNRIGVTRTVFFFRAFRNQIHSPALTNEKIRTDLALQ
ncbi:MAG: hypothetical protein ABJO09_00660 [Hyphomicrobiales bacterium]